MRTVKPEQDAGSVEVGFREPVYYIKISSMDELVANTELIRLSTEFFQYYADENRLEPMQPFDYEFYAANSSYAVDFVNIEKSSGLVYFNQTINTELLSHNIIQLDVGYRVLRNQPNQSRNKVLHNSSKLIIFIASSVLTDEDFNEDLIYHPIWSQTQMNAYVNENSPVKSWLFTETGQPFTVRDFISTETIRALSHNIQNLEERAPWKTIGRIAHSGACHQLAKAADENGFLALNNGVMLADIGPVCGKFLAVFLERIEGGWLGVRDTRKLVQRSHKAITRIVSCNDSTRAAIVT